MKTYTYLIVSVLMITALASCLKEYEKPPLTEPEYTGAEANITIAKLKSLHEKITVPTLIDVDYVIKGIITANDISGNIYKQLYIQDETGGINMGIDQNSIYTEYRVGQEVYVRLKGLYMVMYGDQLQIGYDKTQANRIPWEVFGFYAAKNKWPQADKAMPTTISLSSLEQSKVNTLIKLEKVYFQDGGKLPFSDPNATTNRILKDGNGNSIIVRNSNYATFAATLLPEGGGTVVGVLSKFRADWQLFLRTVDDCQNFGQPIPGGGGGTDPIVVDPTTPSTGTILNETFATSIGGFTEFSVTGSYKWQWDTYKYMKISGFGSGSSQENEDWLISPALDFSKVSSAGLTFEHAINFAGTMATEQTVWISANYTSGAPNTGAWTQLTVPKYPSGNDWIFVSSGNIAIPSAFTGKTNVRIAFKYTSSAEKAATWEVKNVAIK